MAGNFMICPKCGYDCNLSPSHNCEDELESYSKGLDFDELQWEIEGLKAKLRDTEREVRVEKARLSWLKALQSAIHAISVWSLLGFLGYAMGLGLYTMWLDV